MLLNKLIFKAGPGLPPLPWFLVVNSAGLAGSAALSVRANADGALPELARRRDSRSQFHFHAGLSASGNGFFAQFPSSLSLLYWGVLNKAAVAL